MPPAETPDHGAARATVQRARDALAKLCEAVWAGDFKRAWHWEIPTNPALDTDCILVDAFDVADRALDEIAALRAERDAAEQRAELAERRYDAAVNEGRIVASERDAARAERELCREADSENAALRARVAAAVAFADAVRAAFVSGEWGVAVHTTLAAFDAAGRARSRGEGR